jgi:ribose 5-phosphate isomerase A
VADPRDAAKAAAARFAVERYVRRGMRLALGTGTTAEHAVRALRAAHPDAPFDCVASSSATERLAARLGLGIRPLRGDDRFDLMIDGADEIAPDLSLTKGGGGALLREKLLARLSARLVVVADDSKLVPSLASRAPVPVEVVPFARPVLEHAFAEEGCHVRRRLADDGSGFVTENGNELLDVRPPGPLVDPGATEARWRGRVGVVETGLFVGLAERAVVATNSGEVRELVRAPRPGASP